MENKGTLFAFFKPKKQLEQPVINQKDRNGISEGSTSRIDVAGQAPENPTNSNESKRHPSKRKQVSSRELSGSSSSGSDSSDTSRFSESSDESMSSSSEDLSREPIKRSSPPSKKLKKDTTENEVAPGLSLDVDAMFKFGSVQERPLARSFQVASSGDSGTVQNLSTEEIDRLCTGVSPFVALFIRLYYEYCGRFDFPSWYNPKNLKDKNRRSPTDSEYDESTLFVPRKNGKVTEDGHSTPMLQQYWETKEDHFNEIILFKVGKFYELFYIDAAIAQQICNLKWMGHDSRAHVGFPETSLQHHASMLIKEGYTVCVVEQTETVTEANERSANAGKKSSGALVERKICEVFTGGTVIHETMMGPGETYYLCCITESHGEVSLVMADCASGRFFVGLISDLSNLKTVLYSYQPKEIIFDPKSTSGLVGKLLNGFKESMGGSTVLTRWSRWETVTLPRGAAEISKSNRCLETASFGIVNYLTHLLLSEQVVLCSDWSILPPSKSSSTMMMDSTVLSHLEILRDSEGSLKGSLVGFLNRTVTSFGGRLFTKWVCCPLANHDRINERLDAVQWLLSNKAARKRLEDKLASVPDLERRLQRIAAQALQQQRNAVYFGDLENKRMGVFLGFLDSIESVCSVVETLHSAVSETGESVLLARLTEPSDCDEIRAICRTLRAQIDSKKDGNAILYAPRKGAFAEYDSKTEQIRAVEQELKEELARVTAELGIRSGEAIFVNVKFRNEIEISTDHESKLKRSALLDGLGEITSCRKGYVRFQTDGVKKKISTIDQLEQDLKDLLYPFMAKLFSALNIEKLKFLTLINRVGEIDCLISLAKVSGQSTGYTRPQFGGSENSIILRDSRHAIQEHLMQVDRAFVPNDISLRPQESILLVTGANMGGKSTILRQVCITVIMAQMGCFVPAAECQISQPVDRIFTRIGASDNILDGKSTFLTELEETAVMLREATPRSLLVIDELGRGTSTYDGVAIAGATLDYIAKTLGCNCLFATHYHKLCAEENLKNLKHVGLYHMECRADEDGEIELTHKFKNGQYPHSQAMHVARMAGLPESIIGEADRISKEFVNSGLIERRE